MNKKQIRAIVRTKKRNMTEDQIYRASEKLGLRFRESRLYQQARTIYGYLSYNQEVRTVPILRQALKDGKKVAVPKVFGDEMKFIWMDDLSQVSSGYAGIPEPIADGPLGDDPAALVLMPGIAFDRQGHRIGYGGGFYDKFLAKESQHPTIALCYDFQMFESLDVEKYDLPVDCILWAEIGE